MITDNGISHNGEYYTWEVVEKSFDENTHFDGCSFDFVVVDELSEEKEYELSSRN